MLCCRDSEFVFYSIPLKRVDILVLADSSLAYTWTANVQCGNLHFSYFCCPNSKFLMSALHSMFPGIARDLDTYPSRDLSFSEFHLYISGALTRLGCFVSQTENFLSGLQSHLTPWDCTAPSGQRNKYVEFHLWQSLLPTFYSPLKYIMCFFHLTSCKIFSLSFTFSNLIMILLAWFSLYLSWLRSLSCFNL